MGWDGLRRGLSRERGDVWLCWADVGVEAGSVSLLAMAVVALALFIGGGWLPLLLIVGATSPVVPVGGRLCQLAFLGSRLAFLPLPSWSWGKRCQHLQLCHRSPWDYRKVCRCPHFMLVCIQSAFRLCPGDAPPLEAGAVPPPVALCVCSVVDSQKW